MQEQKLLKWDNWSLTYDESALTRDALQVSEGDQVGADVLLPIGRLREQVVQVL